MINAEGVRQFQPRVRAQREPWVILSPFAINPERVRLVRNPFRVARTLVDIIPGFSLCSNPGLKLANAFGVGFLSRVKSVYVKRAFKLINEARDKV
jgi:hypothetical protein